MVAEVFSKFNELAKRPEGLQDVAYSNDPCASEQEHHLIPELVWNKLAVQYNGLPLEILAGGRDSQANLMMLPDTVAGATEQGLALHNGNHPGYTGIVMKEMDDLAKKYVAESDINPALAATHFSENVLELQAKLSMSLDRKMPGLQLLLTSKDPYAVNVPPGVYQFTVAAEMLQNRVQDAVDMVTGNPRTAYPNDQMTQANCEEVRALSPEQLAEIIRKLSADKNMMDALDERFGTRPATAPVPAAARSMTELVADTAREHPVNAVMAGIGLPVMVGIGSAYVASTGLVASSLPRLAMAVPLGAAGFSNGASESLVTALPDQSELVSQGDARGPRTQVDHINWKFTGFAIGDERNTLAALKARDMSDQRPGGAMPDIGAHYLLKADGEVVHSDEHSRSLKLNPLITPGFNANAIGVYVEGNGQLTLAQRKALDGLEADLAADTQLSAISAPSRLMPASNPEKDAWAMATQTPTRQYAPSQPAPQRLQQPGL